MTVLELLALSPSLLLKLVFTVLILAKIIPVTLERFKTWSITSHLKRNFDYPPAHWLQGHMGNNPAPHTPGQEWFRKKAAKYHRGFPLLIGPIDHAFVLNHPDHLRIILSGTEELSMKGGRYRFLRPWLGNGLVTSTGDYWFRHRKLLTSSFHFRILKEHVKVFNESCDVFISKLFRLAQDEKPLRTMHEVSLMTLDSLLKTAFSYESDCQHQQDSAIVKNVEILTGGITERQARPFLALDFIFNLSSTGRRFNKALKDLHQIENELIQSKREVIKNGPGDCEKRRLDFLDTLLLARDEAGNGLSEQEIQDEVSTFLFAGHDTTAAAITALLRILCLHSKHQKKIQEEVDGILDGRETDEILWKDIPKMEFLTMCIKESMRCFTMTTPARVLLKPVKIDGKLLPAGTNINMQPYCLHHNPTVWGDDHMEFKPSRFSKENITKMDPFAFLPFAAGQRNCIGQQFALNEIKVVAARIFRRFNLSLIQDSLMVFTVVARPFSEYVIQLEPRFMD